ncbi:MAG: AAA family ATPase [Magnetospirillum sp.]|nr:AAA family ATPase [Magnetospirillum sp.]
MAINDEVRRLAKKWAGNTGWPKRLEWIEVRGIRGWEGQRLTLPFPIIAIAGENGSGKSTLLQAAACVYQAQGDEERTWFPSEFFPDTAWDEIRGVSIEYGYSQGGSHESGSIRKPTTRWLGHGERPNRQVEYIDLNRIQPVGARVGYARIAKTKHIEKSFTKFDEQQLKRLSSVMGRTYDGAKMAVSDIDDGRDVPVISRKNKEYSGFHQGSGETMVTELLQADLPKYGLVLIDEIESSLHPRAQRRLIRDLAEQCRQREMQIIITTHSPYILEELPPEARMYILESDGIKRIIPGISPDFALTKMDDDVHPECDLYVEDQAAKVMLAEILAFHGKELFTRCAIIPFGTVTVGYALGQMSANGRFPRPSRVFIDGDSAEGEGCVLLPGGDAPEQVVFKSLKSKRWGNLWTRIQRDLSLVDDACTRAMTLSDHHDWVGFAASQLMCGGDTLWQAMCAEWAKGVPESEVAPIVQAVADILP